MTSVIKSQKFVVVNRNAPLDSTLSSPQLLSEETSNESEWAILMNTSTPTDVLSTISSGNALDEDDEILEQVVINQSVIRVEQWLRMGFSRPSSTSPSQASINFIGISILKRVLSNIKPREGLIKACNVEYLDYGYLDRKRFLVSYVDNDGKEGIDNEDEGVLMSNPELDKYLPLAWRKVLNPVKNIRNTNYWNSEETGSGFSWVL